ncbi:MAG: helix-turn-helix domain-containing protein [Actinomycetota bacterium]|nr:helix-turn-helix domain-containing protein [Actinomycetota bacterium]
MEEREWLKPAEVARLLGIPTRELYRLIDEGALPAYKFGRTIRLLASDVEEYQRQRGD